MAILLQKRNSVRENYNEITQTALTSLKEVTEKTDRLLWRCDPSPHIQNITYDEVTRLLQGYIENEVDLNTYGYCFCLCDEQGPKSDRYFNLRETLSDVNANKVVTGLRFVKRNRIFHLQIQQGELLPRGLINESTVEWKPVENYEIGDTTAKEGVDYHTLTYQNRAIDLDEVTKPDDITFVVTGVRFQVLDGHLNLKVHFSQWDFVKGKLIDPEVNSIWQSNDNVYNREQLRLDNKQVPTLAYENPRYSKNSQYLEFTNSGGWGDASQTTIPFIDIQEVEFKPPVPLAGIGIHHRGYEYESRFASGFGGFVGPKIVSYDLSPHLG
ncbi:uncharacterized protein LOC132788200 [Drosophila nasuta]|uniref:uncharacterized protein LOC132788200 n=1 Tax=Drosophila nasuta TaxID=42062 RepID=UPI00295F4474|nr:uncharacterized protein LOC132788200 [Drosophila nasuta]